MRYIQSRLRTCCKVGFGIVILGLVLLTQVAWVSHDSQIQVPPGLQKGSVVELGKPGLWTGVWQIEEISGNWVLATETSPKLFKPGTKVWVNLGNVDVLVVLK
jgi:hypothetical protein